MENMDIFRGTERAFRKTKKFSMSSKLFSMFSMVLLLEGVSAGQQSPATSTGPNGAART